MKKTILTFLFAAGILSAAAQDTLYIHPSEWPSNYFKASWWQVYDSLAVIGFEVAPIEFDERAWRMITEDTLTVYGLAASMSTWEVMEPDRYEIHPELWMNEVGCIKDTSYDYVYDYLRLYEADPDSLRQVGEELKVHIKHTPVAYYMNTGLKQRFLPSQPLPILPMYECYFSEPVTVADSFYVGRYHQSHRPMLDTSGHIMQFTTKAVLMHYLTKGTEPFTYTKEAFHGDTTMKHLHMYEPQYYEWMYAPNTTGPLLFPILTPEDTTQHHGGGDTLSVGSASLVDRLTGVMPNPATVSAKVVSSLGLQQVELYNTAGDLVHSQQASGFSATLDLSPLPSGTYILRIATPAGTAVKKLVVAE